MTEVIDAHSGAEQPAATELSPLLRSSDFWTDEMVAAAGIVSYDMPIVTVGGGMGSFITADYLRVAGGLPTSDIQVISNLSHPWQTYERLASVSQIAQHDRIRSDSASRPDNIWGFPSYALTEAIRGRTLAPLWQVLVEPVFADFYTPRLQMVMESIAVEARRIRYWDMLRRGDVEMVRRRVGGGYFVLFADQRVENPTLQAVRCRDVHLAVGYTGLKFLPELQEFRTAMKDYHHVVNAYENHEHVYHALSRRPGTVLVRGGGIVASRVLERLIRDRLTQGLETRIVHVLRTYFDGPNGRQSVARRRGRDGFAYQGFNYPKSVWGGQLKAEMRNMHETRRTKVYDDIGGTTTAWRREWQRQLRIARTGGWYRALNASVVSVRPDGDGVATRLRIADGELDVHADYIIDCTGLNADVAEHQVLGDLLEHGGAQLNAIKRIDVDEAFGVAWRGQRHGAGIRHRSGLARRAVPRRGHLPRPADRRTGGRRRHRPAWLLPTARPGVIAGRLVALDDRPADLNLTTG